MLAPHMSNKIIISLDPFFSNIFASVDWTVKPLGKVNNFIVSVKGLFRFEWCWPSAAERITGVGTMGASVWTSFPS